ncbi:sulfite exporter TauE/SafE family protein [Pseudolabrys taiwanensis]|uniref:Probable membrane transporter protein n=1 Tax=Pseudolabrys taiwanensis TaxID=331696 RepID=A0A345ZYY2_9HYPH|nr:sulfite exporter TauE/SafE family protein [Pseudolabrys taiwanensis]AXK82129.1 sulfite exporter TauE/SafE family protein [Pseudolabrys taiwanensis]
MTLHSFLMLALAGIGGGMLSSMVGGAAVVTYPALLAAGLPPVTATTCNLAASFPGILIATLADRKQLPPVNRAFVGMLIASMLGAAVGAGLLLITPQHTFAVLVPILLGFATLMCAVAEPIGNWLHARAQKRGKTIDFSVTNLKMLLPVSLYGGYFGAGVGVLILGVMSIATRGNYRAANVAKNLVGTVNNATAAAIFAFQGQIMWPQTLALAAGTVAGGFAGAWLARIMPRAVMRVAVVVTGASLTGYFALKYWF